jgi:itaconyl-CoA hydratase/mesaconyl-C4 CoA hydratase
MDPAARSGLEEIAGAWRPGPLEEADWLASAPVAALSAVFDLPGPAARSGDPLPPLWQWLYFLSWPAQSSLGEDGHPRDGRFLPPVPRRQRMFAGGRCTIEEPLRVGEPAERRTGLESVTLKQGSTGDLLFVTTRSEFRQHGRLCLVEEQDIVYRSGRSTARHPATVDAAAVPPEAAPEDAWRLPLLTDPALLFRISALTANTHRIHYDAPYVRDEEGYPGVVVHGPLLALAMLEAVRRNAAERRVRSLTYRLRYPAFVGEQLLVSGREVGGGGLGAGGGAGVGAELRVASHRENRHATASVEFA